MLRESGPVLGIDAGGTAIRAQALNGGRVVHVGVGGPGNPLVVSEEELLRRYESALRGCPNPVVIAACVAGTGSVLGRERVERLLASLFPDASVHVFPDYVAAWMTVRDETDALVVAGTGSIVCSRRSDGSFRTSGGHGWVLGDHGSAARLGRLALDHYCTSLEEPASATVEAVYGARTPGELASIVQSSPSPAAVLAKAAPLLTAAAADGAAWAKLLLSHEMETLATTLAKHLGSEPEPPARPQVALAGGVWNSRAAHDAFVTALGAAGLIADVEHVNADAAGGAARLAEELRHA